MALLQIVSPALQPRDSSGRCLATPSRSTMSEIDDQVALGEVPIGQVDQTLGQCEKSRPSRPVSCLAISAARQCDRQRRVADGIEQSDKFVGEDETTPDGVLSWSCATTSPVMPIASDR